MEEEKSRDWYKSMSFYQIWVRSFADGNGDGIGDLYGVYDKLEYVKSLGVDGIWFSPIYPSPNADYGYDISDYRDIHPDFGDLEQFKKVLAKAHELGLKVIMDLVVNHTSDEHPWFIESRKGKDNPYSDYYIWRDKPNNWDSLFEGKAWEYDEIRGQYYLHIFAKKQPDLNMDNPKVREEVKGIMRFWLDMGVDGFREDVINFISKKEGLPDGMPLLPAAERSAFFTCRKGHVPLQGRSPYPRIPFGVSEGLRQLRLLPTWRRPYDYGKVGHEVSHRSYQVSGYDVFF